MSPRPPLKRDSRAKLAVFVITLKLRGHSVPAGPFSRREMQLDDIVCNRCHNRWRIYRAIRGQYSPMECPR